MQLEKDDEKIIGSLKYADSPLKRIKGLMFKELEEDEGLLMEFKNNSKWSLWMLFVPQDLALFFMNEEGKVVDKKLGEKMTLDPRTWKIYKPEEKCKYVLECNPEKLEDIQTGDGLSW